MNNPTELRPMFSYSTTPIILLLFIISILILYIFYQKKEKKPEPIIVKPPVKNLFTIKDHYRQELDTLEQEVNNQTIANREAYQRLSIIIRNFIFEVTQIRVQYYTLQEIMSINIPDLTLLVQEYYDPEFAKESKGAIKSSLEKTREVIEKWR